MRISTDLSLLTFFRNVGSRKNTLKCFPSALLPSTKCLTAGGTNTEAKHIVCSFAPNAQILWQSTLVKWVCPDTFIGLWSSCYCSVHPAALFVSQKRAAQSPVVCRELEQPKRRKSFSKLNRQTHCSLMLLHHKGSIKRVIFYTFLFPRRLSSPNATSHLRDKKHNS